MPMTTKRTTEEMDKKHTTLVDEISSTYSNHGFTLGNSLWIYLESYWKSSDYYEQKLLDNIPFIKSKDEMQSQRKVEIMNTPVSDDGGGYMHEVCITNTAERDTEEALDIILVHGYGAALGFFYKNIEGLSTIPGSRLHLIDLLGFGSSGRPRFPIEGNNGQGEDCIKKVLNAEAFFVDSFENWRLKRNIKKCVVVAHSLGGYLMSCYYLKYGREVVTKLVLVSPVGVEDNDMSLYKKYKEGGCGGEHGDDDEEEEEVCGGNVDTDDEIDIDREYRVAMRQGVDLAKELTDHLHDGDGDRHGGEADEDEDGDDKSIFSIDSEDHEEKPTKIEKLMRQIKTRVVPGKLLTWLWERNFTPINIVRLFGPLAGRVIAIWVYNRFSRVDSGDELCDMCKYTTSVFLDRGSGEYCLGSILAPGSLARLPLSNRLPGQLKIPVLVLYGEIDWMDKKAGYELCKSIGKNAKFRIIPGAGHHLYVDNIPEFERQVLSFING